MGIRIKVNQVPTQEISSEPKTGISKHNWSEEDATESSDRLSMRSFWAILASMGILHFFTGKDKIELNSVKDYSPTILMKKKPLQKRVSVEKIRKTKNNFSSTNSFLRGPSSKLKGIPKRKILKDLFRDSRRKAEK